MKLEWVVRHFTCDAKMKKTAGVEMVIGTGPSAEPRKVYNHSSTQIPGLLGLLIDFVLL